jgi:hypothetical protein
LVKMTIFQKCGPRADLGWPWLIYWRKGRNRAQNLIQLLATFRDI